MVMSFTYIVSIDLYTGVGRVKLYSFISDQSAGADLSSIRQDEPIELTRAKQLIFDTLVDWSERR